MSEIDQFDQVEHFWCPQLGQTITFSYCRRVQQGLPCSRVETCFSPHFDVSAFIAEHYTPEEREVFLGPQPGRLERVLEALEKSRKDQDGGES
jgi:hypothetical protein